MLGGPVFRCASFRVVDDLLGKNSPASHAFILITIETKNGLKEEAIGFQAFVGGPGMTHSEFQKKPARFSEVSVSLKRNITRAQRQEIYQLANRFNSAKCTFLDNNCIDFVDSVARGIGLKAPARASSQTPVQYVTELKRLN